MSTTVDHPINLPNSLIAESGPPLVGDLTFKRTRTWDNGYVYLAEMPVLSARQRVERLLESQAHPTHHPEENMSSRRSARSLDRQTRVSRKEAKPELDNAETDNENDEPVTFWGTLFKILPLIGILFVAVYISQSTQLSPVVGVTLLLLEVALAYVGLRVWFSNSSRL